MEYHVRLIEFASAEWIATIELRNRVLRQPLGLELSEEELHSQRDCIHLAAYGDGKLAGTLLLVPLNDETIQMRQVVVEPGLQRSGAGAALVHAAEHVARAKGFTRMMLHARDTAVGFYERLGYKRVGDYFEEHTIPHLELEKFLAPGPT